MIGLLKGTVATNRRNPVILTVAGVGYLVSITSRLLTKLTVGDSLQLFTHTHVRDDALELYGFATVEELDLFTLLLTVSGIGPKTALLVIDRGEEAVRHAVSSSDVEFFTSIPRLGKKNSQKIIIELKSKLGSIKDLDLNETLSGDTAELMEVLLSMGFGKPEVREAIKKLDLNDKTMEQKIRHALRLLGRSVS